MNWRALMKKVKGTYFKKKGTYFILVMSIQDKYKKDLILITVFE